MNNAYPNARGWRYELTFLDLEAVAAAQYDFERGGMWIWLSNVAPTKAGDVSCPPMLIVVAADLINKLEIYRSGA